MNEINNFCVKKALQSMNFHDLTLGKRSALERFEKVSDERFIFTDNATLREARLRSAPNFNHS